MNTQLLIAHRGNVSGRDPDNENTEPYILEALHQGYIVEVDVWAERNQSYFMLGHDHPEHELKNTLALTSPRIWCHAKNIHALQLLLAMRATCFYIDGNHPCVVVRNEYIWTSPNNELAPRSIAVMPEYSSWSTADLAGAAGICSDNIAHYAKETQEIWNALRKKH